jgi:hypothetical protein
MKKRDNVKKGLATLSWAAAWARHMVEMVSGVDNSILREGSMPCPYKPDGPHGTEAPPILKKPQNDDSY